MSNLFGESKDSEEGFLFADYLRILNIRSSQFFGLLAALCSLWCVSMIISDCIYHKMFIKELYYPSIMGFVVIVLYAVAQKFEEKLVALWDLMMAILILSNAVLALELTIVSKVKETDSGREYKHSEDRLFSVFNVVMMLVSYSILFKSMMSCSKYKIIVSIIEGGYLCIRIGIIIWIPISRILFFFTSLALYYFYTEKNLRASFSQQVKRLQEEKIWKNILRVTSDGIAVISQNRSLIFSNDAMRKMLHKNNTGLILEEILSLSDLRILPDTKKLLIRICDTVINDYNSKTAVDSGGFSSQSRKTLTRKSFTFTKSESNRVASPLRKTTNFFYLKERVIETCEKIKEAALNSKIDFMALLDLFSLTQEVEMPHELFCGFLVFDYKYVPEVTPDLEKRPNVKRHQFRVQLVPLEKEITMLIIVSDLTQFNIIDDLRGTNEYQALLMKTFSHEMRTPLNHALSHVQVLMHDQELTKSCKLTTQIISPLYSSCKQLYYLTCDLLDISSLRATVYRRKNSISKSPISIRAIFDEVRDIYKNYIEEKKLQLQTFIDPKVPDQIGSDYQRIMQIFTNLISNSLKFTTSGYIKISAEPARDRHILLKVEDTGIGMEQSEVENVLRWLKEKSDTRLSNHSAGIGIGLRICFLLSRLLADEDHPLEIKSELGKGTCVGVYIKDWNESNGTLVLPDRHKTSDGILIDCSHSEIELDDINELNSNYLSPSHQRLSGFTTKSLVKSIVDTAPSNLLRCVCDTILIVDDDNFNILSLKTLLNCLKHTQIEMAFNGKQAIEKVRKQSLKKCSAKCRGFRLIFMDVNMPIMDGIQATKILQEKFDAKEMEPIPIIACTAYGDASTKNLCLEAGMSGFISKPVNIKDLVALLKKFPLLEEP